MVSGVIPNITDAAGEPSKIKMAVHSVSSPPSGLSVTVKVSELERWLPRWRETPVSARGSRDPSGKLVIQLTPRSDVGHKFYTRPDDPGLVRLQVKTKKPANGVPPFGAVRGPEAAMVPGGRAWIYLGPDLPRALARTKKTAAPAADEAGGLDLHDLNAAVDAANHERLRLGEDRVVFSVDDGGWITFLLGGGGRPKKR